ncbi:hypothetical protein MKEN_00742900 [Mycena kentingensis (nom. inval.)]|nr:hypothetical protein MKEN_00742900 [Mycena kentingensis (nom. inval.)]
MAHPELHLDNLDSLPLPLRLLAKSACRPDAEPAMIQRVLWEVGRTIFFPPQDRALVSACYYHLETAAIPTANDLENVATLGTARQNVWRAVNAGQAVLRLPVLAQCITQEAFRDVWERLLPWSVFLHDYWYRIPGIQFTAPRGDWMTDLGPDRARAVNGVNM